MRHSPRADARTGRSSRLATLILATLALTACSDIFPPSHPYSTLDVRVVSDQGEPLAGIGLVLYDWKRQMAFGETDIEGRHTFGYIPEGGYGVWVGEPAGFRLPEGANPYIDGISLANSDRKSVEFVLIPARGTLRVRTMEPDSVPVPGVRLLLYSTDGRTLEVETGADGLFTFDLRIGEYGLRPTPPPGYSIEPEYADGIVVTEQSEADVTFVLTPSG